MSAGRDASITAAPTAVLSADTTADAAWRKRIGPGTGGPSESGSSAGASHRPLAQTAPPAPGAHPVEPGPEAAPGAGGDDFDEAAAFAPARLASPAETSGAVPPPPDDDGAPWPTDASVDAAFLHQAGDRADTTAASAGLAAAAESPAETPGEKAKLPPLADLVARVPADVMRTLEELFRARFYDVRKVRKADLNPAALPPAAGS